MQNNNPIFHLLCRNPAQWKFLHKATNSLSTINPPPRSCFAALRALALSAAVITLALSACNSYGLVDKLENPGSLASGNTNSGEEFVSLNYVFVSSWNTTGDLSMQPFSQCNSLSNIARADCACTEAAATNHLRKHASHQFRAWLSTSTANAKCRVLGLANGCDTNVAQSWHNTMGEVIVSNFSGFSSGALQKEIRYSESKVNTAPDLVWTGTNSSGDNSSTNCVNWTSQNTADSGSVGRRLDANANWTQNSSPVSQTCDTTQRLYCLAMP